MYAGYNKLEFEEKESIVIISASVENTYLLFGFKETPHTLKRTIDIVDVYAIESTTISPKYEIYPPGNRQYILTDWNEIGMDIDINE